MTSHELARQLLALPNLPVLTQDDDEVLTEVESASVKKLMRLDNGLIFNFSEGCLNGTDFEGIKLT